jgi:hypothetical protein
MLDRHPVVGIYAGDAAALAVSSIAQDERASGFGLLGRRRGFGALLREPVISLLVIGHMHDRVARLEACLQQKTGMPAASGSLRFSLQAAEISPFRR